MLKMIQIRNVPDSLHRKLKARAAIEGMTLSDYFMAEILRGAERSPLKELRKRPNQRKPFSPKIPPDKAVRQERNSR
jgi:plasmid stability protein